MPFQVTQCYTKEDVAAYYYAATKNSNRRTRALRHAFQFSFLISAVALVALAGWLMWWVFQQTLFLLSALAVLPALIALLYSSYVLLHSILASTEKGSIKNMWAGYSQKGGQMTITFEDAQFIMALPWYETHYQYAAIKVIMESDGHYFLSLVNNTYIILRKSCLIEGDPAVLGSFIRQKRQEALFSAEKDKGKDRDHQ